MDSRQKNEEMRFKRTKENDTSNATSLSSHALLSAVRAAETGQRSWGRNERALPSNFPNISEVFAYGYVSAFAVSENRGSVILTAWNTFTK